MKSFPFDSHVVYDETGAPVLIGQSTLRHTDIF